jgi:hypothetical protein
MRLGALLNKYLGFINVMRIEVRPQSQYMLKINFKYFLAR